MSPRQRRWLARWFGILVVLPSLLAYGAGAGGVVSTAVVSGAAVVGLVVYTPLPWVALVGLTAALAAHGPARVLRALVFALGGADPGAAPRRELEAVGDTLALAARVVVALGLAWCTAEAVLVLAGIDAALHGRGAPAGAMLSRGAGAALVVPLGALVLGHLGLGQAAEAAYRASGRDTGRAPGPPALGGFAGPATLLYALPLVFLLVMMFVRFD